MKTLTITPVDRERSFGIDELFFSTTDRKGIIRTGNRVFARVSGHSASELPGKPHNIIRHPDMPRAAFRLLWDYLGAGRPIAAYVKNMAADGAHYWVLATVVPHGDGYLSVRIRPSSPYFAAVRDIYAELLAVEQQAEADGASRKEAIDVSVAHLSVLLAAAGFADYDEFMHLALSAEIRSRDALIAAERKRAPERAATAKAPTAGEGGSGGQLESILDSCKVLQSFLDARFARLDEYVSLNQQLAGKSSFVLGLADGIRLSSLNAIVAAARLETGGAALGVVADIMRSRSHETATLIRGLTGEIAEAVDVLRDLGFGISLAHLQTEMAMVFVSELLEDGQSVEAATIRGIETLAGSIGDSLEGVLSSLSSLEARLSSVADHVVGLRESLKVLNALQTSGRIEATRLDDATAFTQLFLSVRTQVAEAQAQMADFTAVAGNAEKVTPREADQLRSELRLIAEQSGDLHALAA